MAKNDENQDRETKSVKVSTKVWRQISMLGIEWQKSNGQVLDRIIQEWERGKKGRK